MTDKEFRRLSKSELIDIIYEYQKQEKRLKSENEILRRKLDDRDFKLKDVGNIAEAFSSISDIFEQAQNIADQFVSNTELVCNRKIREAELEAQRIIDKAKN